MMVYLTLKRGERGGPMVMDKCFLNNDHAVEYIDSQPGIDGVRKKWSEEKWGDWQIKEIEVLSYSGVDPEKEKEERRRQALLKLSDEDKELLGITE